MTDTIQRLARAIRAAPAPSPASLFQAKLLLLDAIGCGLLGARESVSHSVAETCGRTGACVVIGRGWRSSILDAVLLNGVAVRALDFNDYLVTLVAGEPETGGHPSDNIPAALAVGPVYGRSGAQILAAMALGYELYARQQAMIDRAGPWDGVSASGMTAAAIAGSLIGLDEIGMAHALSLGLARAATPSVVRREKLSAAKTMANALVAQSGVQAALFAKSGVTGPVSILDSDFGLRGLFAHFDPERLTQPFPQDGAIMDARVKIHPCVNTGQSVVAAALALHARLTEEPQSLARIELIMPDNRIVARQQGDPSRNRPASRESADHSFAFLAAASLLDGAFGPAQFENERWMNPAVTALMERIVLRRDPGMTANASSPFPCTIRATGTDGREYVAEDRGSAGRLNASAVIGKFHANLRPILPHATREAIVDAVMEFDQCPSSAPLDAVIATGESAP